MQTMDAFCPASATKNMSVLAADCSQFVCEIPHGGNNSNSQIREHIFHQKIATIKKFIENQNSPKDQTK